MKTAVMVNDTNIGDANYHIMSELNNVVNGLDDVFMLTHNVSSKVIEADFAIINASKVNNLYDGIIIATTIDTARALIKASTNSIKLYYIYNFEWMETVYNFDEVYDMLHNPHLTLICRSEIHQKMLKKVFGVDVPHIVREFDLGAIWNLLENTKKS